MASPPKDMNTTANADAPLTSEELAADRVASPQSTDPLEKPAAGDSSIVSEDRVEDGDESGGAGHGRGIEEALINLPPG